MEKKILKLPNQFGVMPLGKLLEKVMLDDLRKFCEERGLDPDDHMPNFPDDSSGQKEI